MLFFSGHAVAAATPDQRRARSGGERLHQAAVPSARRRQRRKGQTRTITACQWKCNHRGCADALAFVRICCFVLGILLWTSAPWVCLHRLNPFFCVHVRLYPGAALSGDGAACRSAQHAPMPACARVRGVAGAAVPADVGVHVHPTPALRCWLALHGHQRHRAVAGALYDRHVVHSVRVADRSQSGAVALSPSASDKRCAQRF